MHENIHKFKSLQRVESTMVAGRYRYNQISWYLKTVEPISAEFGVLMHNGPPKHKGYKKNQNWQ